jgi:hypothetical protein
VVAVFSVVSSVIWLKMFALRSVSLPVIACSNNMECLPSKLG